MAAFSKAQLTFTATVGGATVVEVSTNVLGIPTTSIIQTITSAAAVAASTTTPAAVAPPPDTPINQGPVGQPGPTITDQPTVYRYTTTDGNGDTTVVTDTFTPTFPASSGTPPPPSSTGTILNYSSWLSIIGTNTVPPSNAAISRWQLPQAGLGVIATLLSGLLAGACFTLA